jgi:hypothetical protein
VRLGRGGFGRKLLATEVSRYKQDWETRVAERRAKADKLVLQNQVGIALDEISSPPTPAANWSPPPVLALIAYVESLPTIMKQAYALAMPEWNIGATNTVAQATYQVISVVEHIFVQLAHWYPPNHFGQKPAAEFFTNFIQSRFEFRFALLEPGGPSTGGSMIRSHVAYGVLLDAQNEVLLTVRMLCAFRSKQFIDDWQVRWKEAIEGYPCLGGSLAT